MKTSLSKQGVYLGAGAGLVLFGIYGLVLGSLLGGAAGIGFAGMLFGLPLEPGLLPRMIVLTSMIVGIFISGTLMVMASSTIGWLIGAAIRTTVHEKTLIKMP